MTNYFYDKFIKQEPKHDPLKHIPKNKQTEYDAYGEYANSDPDDLFFKGSKLPINKPTIIPLVAQQNDESWKLDYSRELNDPIKVIFPKSSRELSGVVELPESISFGPVSTVTLKGIISVDVKIESLNDLVIDSKIFKIKRLLQEKLSELKDIDITTNINVEIVSLGRTVKI